MQKQKIWPSFLVLVLISFFLLFLNKLGWLQSLQSGVEVVTVPVKSSVYRFGQNLSNGLGTIKDLWGVQSLRAENEKLKTALLASQGLSLRSYSLKEENLALRKQLEAPLPASMQFLPAKTLGIVRYLTIDKGSNDGVGVGQIVVSQNVLVGKIVSITPKTAEVLLPSDSDSKIPVRTLKINSRGLLTGEAGVSSVLDKVLQAEKLEKDDLIITTGEAGYPRDLLIGKIFKINKNDVEPFQKASVQLLLDYGKLDNVFIIK